MHGYDWARIREQYKTWLPYVAHRSDLNYVISEMIAELATQHSYIEGGDFNTPARIRVALPGARFEVDKGANRYRIAKIYDGPKRRRNLSFAAQRSRRQRQRRRLRSAK
jgi:tricorn protease